MMSSQRKSWLISLVVPVLNEQDAIAPFLRRVVPCLEEAARRIGYWGAYEIVFVDDGSTDATLAALSAERRNNSAVKVVVLSRNFGKDAALAAGMNYALGDAVIPIDVDLQDPPEIIPLLVDNWLEGAKIVNALRADRTADTGMKRLTARAFYSAYNRMAERPIPAEAGDFRLIDREVIDVLKLLPERARFMKGLVSWVGFPTQDVRYVREKREAGHTKWNYWKLWNFALDGVTTSTTVPLRLWTYLGAAVSTLGFGYALFIVLLTLIAGRDAPGYASLMVAILLLGGLNLLSLGILGEYIGRIFNEVKGRPLFIVRSTIGIDAGIPTRKLTPEMSDGQNHL